MHMMDWNGYRDQVFAGVGAIGKISPDTTRGYATLSNAGEKTGHLDKKTRELIAVACAVSLRCDGCITVHTKAAREAGASEDELTEALGVAIALNAGAGLVYSTRAMDAFGAAAEA
ncbi:carboxymuconolactone decarboxylase family protein [Novosphingobium sp. P6W]|uniref:carboxymuconolactone decarboxylase family protein n=1 Tax=Novosphingobium sp. P6W TaxID=1609758 RepID=UPI000B19FC4C